MHHDCQTSPSAYVDEGSDQYCVPIISSQVLTLISHRLDQMVSQCELHFIDGTTLLYNRLLRFPQGALSTTPLVGAVVGLDNLLRLLVSLALCLLLVDVVKLRTSSILNG